MYKDKISEIDTSIDQLIYQKRYYHDKLLQLTQQN